MKEENIVRQILKNEFTWIAGIIGACWMVVIYVILPINTIQSTLIQVQQSQLDNKNFNQQIVIVDSDFNSRISVLESIVNKLNK